jgi:hypothetical protein
MEKGYKGLSQLAKNSSGPAQPGPSGINQTMGVPPIRADKPGYPGSMMHPIDDRRPPHPLYPPPPAPLPHGSTYYSGPTGYDRPSQPPTPSDLTSPRSAHPPSQLPGYNYPPPPPSSQHGGGQYSQVSESSRRPRSSGADRASNTMASAGPSPYTYVPAPTTNTTPTTTTTSPPLSQGAGSGLNRGSERSPSRKKMRLHVE